MSNNTLAFFIGLLGSVHCIGMCGPLAFSINSPKDGNWLFVIGDKLLYNIGRVVTYTILGVIIGFVGKQLWLTGLQRGVSIASGLLIIMAGLSRMFKASFIASNYFSKIWSPVHRSLNYAFNHHAGHFVIGLLNGFLPCGFVYLALAGAINTITPTTAGQYMFFFGLGTFPLMLAATIGSGFIGPAFRRKINKAIPYLMICLGFWFILRGLNLDIPYLSPAARATGANVCH